MKGKRDLEQVIRVKYNKKGPIKYISHLNLAQVFTRALRRANIPVVISSGFNPRFRISFGPPLALGISGESEFFDIRLKKIMKIEALIKKMNQALPLGIEIISAQIISPSTDSLVKSIDKATYLIDFELNSTAKNLESEIENNIEHFLGLKEIWIEKMGKMGSKKINIRPTIASLKILDLDMFNGKLKLKLELKISNNGNLNPNYVIRAWLLKYHYGFDLTSVSRTSLSIADKEVMKS